MKRDFVRFWSVFLLLYARPAAAQLVAGTNGIFISSNTAFFYDGLTLQPNNNLSLNENTLVKNELAIAWPTRSSIVRLYQFSKPIQFQGSLTLNYRNTDLNGNRQEELGLVYSPVPSINYKDYSYLATSHVDLPDWSVRQASTLIPALSYITAVSPDDDSSPGALKATNMITPNGDGVNDTWVVRNIDQFPNNRLDIYNRHGKLVYTKLGYDNSWDGKYSGNALVEDTYYYILTINSGERKLRGFISVVREE
jgi:gliding motility-associated-like protein